MNDTEHLARVADESNPTHFATDALLNFIQSANHLPIDENVIEKTKHHIVDALAATISGTKLHVGRLALSACSSFQGAPEAIIFGQQARFPAYWAAMFNAMLAHADETDDSHERSTIHPGCGIVSSALAMVQRHNRSGLAFIRAVAAGYDVGARMSEALGSLSLNVAGISSHAVGALWGSGGAAAVAAALDANSTRHLWSYLAHETSGLACWMEEYDHVQKAYVFGAMGAKNAVTAAILCEAGWTGLHDALEGAHRLIPTLGQEVSERGFDVPMRFGEEILNSNIKKWCVGSPIQAALDALEILTPQIIDVGQISSVQIEIRTDAASVVDNRDMPNICLQHLAALFLCDRGVSFESVHDRTRMVDPRVLALRDRVFLFASDKLQKAGGRQAVVRIILADGRVLEHHTRHVRGTWGDLMPRAEVSAKAQDLIEPILGPFQAKALIDGLWELDELDPENLCRLLSEANMAIAKCG